MAPSPTPRSTVVGPVGRRQFLLSPDGTTAPPGYQHHLVGPLHLYTCPALPVVLRAAPDGTPRALLGVATGTESGAAPPTEQLGSLDRATLERASHHWSGRWVLVDGDDIHPDATGLLAVFLGRGRAASAPFLLAPDHPAPDLGLQRDHVLPFLPGPDTGIPGVVRALPSQVHSLLAGTARPRELPQAVEVEEGRAPELLEDLGEQLLSAVAGAAELGPLVVPLTAGYDSRLALAACVRLGLEPRLITQAYPGASRADLRLPPEMGRRLGLEHTLVRPSRRDPHAAELYDRQVSGLIRETDRTFFARGQFDWCAPGDVLLRGIAFDGTRGALHRTLDGVPLDADGLAQALGASRAQRAALGHWVDLVRDHPQQLSVHDRFWFEQKCASYAATTELALDLLGPHSVLPGNSRRYQETALSLPWSWRQSSHHHVELVRRWAPAVADLPYNPPRTPTEKVLRLGGSLRRRARAFQARAQSSHI